MCFISYRRALASLFHGSGHLSRLTVKNQTCLCTDWQRKTDSGELSREDYEVRALEHTNYMEKLRKQSLSSSVRRWPRWWLKSHLPLLGGELQTACGHIFLSAVRWQRKAPRPQILTWRLRLFSRKTAEYSSKMLREALQICSPQGFQGSPREHRAWPDLVLPRALQDL